MGIGTRWKVATIRGIPLYVGASWPWIAALYAWSWYTSFTQGVARLQPADALMLALVASALFFGSVLLHEGAHAAVARSLGLPVTGITLVFWGGATETRADARGPWAAFLVAFVGPASTLVMSGAFLLAEQLAHGTVAYLLHWLAVISLLFAALNALPGFPLDGGRMFLGIVWGLTGNRRTGLRAAGYAGVGIGAAMIGVGVWYLTRTDPFIGFFIVYIGVTILTTGRGMDRKIAIRDQLMRGTVAEAMRPAPPVVPADLSLAQALDRYLRGDRDATFPVVGSDGSVIGTISMATARKVGGRDPTRPAREGMAPLSHTRTVAPEERLGDVLEWLSGRDSLVLEGDRLVGALGPSEIERWYRRVVQGHETPPVAAIPPRPDV